MPTPTPPSIHVHTWDRHETFHDVMADHLRSAPWYLISLTIHGLVALILLSVSTQRPTPPKEETLTVAQPETVDEVVPDKQEPEIKPEPVEFEEVPVPEITDIVDTTQQAIDSLDLSDPFPDTNFDATMSNDVIGIGGGAGPTGGGGRLGRIGGTPRAPILTVDLGLDWLRDHQDSDGRWSASGYMKHCPAGDRCEGPGNPVCDVGVTGLALLAFLGRGETMRTGKYKETVKRATLWLKDQMDDSGMIGTDAGHSYMYSHAIATLAFVESVGWSKSRVLRPYAQRAIDFIQRSRNAYRVWRYHPRDGNNDTSVTGWMVFALKSAKDFDFKVDKEALDASLSWFEEVTDPSTGQAGYTRRGEPSSRKVGLEEKFPHEKTEALTAVGALCRIFLGQDPRENPTLVAATKTMLKRPPTWNPADGSIDFYYWYYASYALFQVGGSPWKQWRRALEPAVMKNQHRNGDSHNHGSWDPISAWGDDGGRVYATAINVLTMEVYYRYSRLAR